MKKFWRWYFSVCPRSCSCCSRELPQRLRFPAAGPTPPVAGSSRTPIPSAGFDGAEPRGLFYRLQVGLGTTQMETRVLIFLPQRVLRVYPFGDVNMIDLARCNPDTCGRYRLDGGWLSVRWDNGATQRLGFARVGPGFTLDGDAYQPARPLEAPSKAWRDPVWDP